MKLNKDITIEFTNDDLHEVFSEYLATRGYELMQESGIEVNLKTEYAGYGRNEMLSTVFDNIKINCKEIKCA